MLTIIGCGNSNRSDDGVGVYVAQQLIKLLHAHPKQNVRVFDAGTGGIEVMFQARGASRLIIIDASRTGSAPGAIFQVPGDELIGDRQLGYSLHDFRWDHALYAGRRIFRDNFPDDVTVFLIEAEKLDLGLELTQPAKIAADNLLEQLQKIIAEYD